MTQAISRDRVEDAIARAVDGLDAMVRLLPVTHVYPQAVHAMIANVQGAVIAEGLTLRHWPTLAELVRVYQRRCHEGGLEPWEFPT